jgi:SAM-dependent methyltransferase
LEKIGEDHRLKANRLRDRRHKNFPNGLAGKTFLDIGCGSGLHSLAALSLGAASVTAVDIDEKTPTTQRKSYSPDMRPDRNGRRASVFDASPDVLANLTSSIPGVCSITPVTCGGQSNVPLIS